MAVKQTVKENRHHMVLTGPGVSETIKKSGLGNLFNLRQLNYLSITRTCLQSVPEEIGNLTNLTTLLLHTNEITALPGTIDKLINLTALDCSGNKLTSCPREFGNLPRLKRLNLASNLLESIPSQRANVALSILNLENNMFRAFPDVCYAELVRLSELYLNNNEIEEIPLTISQLPALKILNLQCNLIKDLPDELADCDKLEKLNLQLNKMQINYDSNLEPLCSSVSNTKSLLNYLKLNPPRKTLLNRNKMCRNRKEDINYKHVLEIEGVTNDGAVIEVTEHVDGVRPFIAACIVKNINFTEENFKKFIQLQKRLHNGVCDNKNAATIWTHDMKFMGSETYCLTYTAKPPEKLEIAPLMRSKMYTGKALFEQLLAEAENVRKITNVNAYAERYKYLNLLEGKSLFPCLLDSQQVISFPPIVNSNVTKVSRSTQTMFVEVTSTTSYAICRNILNQFLKEMLISGLTDPTLEDYHKLFVQQVRVEDTDGNEKLIYPSNADFKDLEGNSDINVVLPSI